jgi:hypothetical protein
VPPASCLAVPAPHPWRTQGVGRVVGCYWRGGAGPGAPPPPPLPRRPKPRRPEEAAPPRRRAARPPRACVAVAVPAPHTRRTEGEGVDEISCCALLALVGAPQVFFDSCVGGAGVDEGQARVNMFVEIAPHPRRHPQLGAVLLESHRGFVVQASHRLGPGSRFGGGEEVHKAAGGPPRGSCDMGAWISNGRDGRSRRDRPAQLPESSRTALRLH